MLRGEVRPASLCRLPGRIVAGQPVSPGAHCAHGRQPGRRTSPHPHCGSVGWPGYLVPAAAFAGAVGVLTTSLLGRPAWRNRRGMAFGSAKLSCCWSQRARSFGRSPKGSRGPTHSQAWLLHPESFFTGEFLFAALTLLFVWGFSVGVTADFLDLAIQPDEVAARSSHDWGDSKSQWRVAMPMARTEILQRFALRWIGSACCSWCARP